jgi:small subunit ribosomal protein S17
MKNKVVYKRILEGVVTSDKMNKTITVAVSRFKKHSVYKKYFSVIKKYKAHDENNSFKVGNKVKIRESKPISKDKRWTVIEEEK